LILLVAITLSTFPSVSAASAPTHSRSSVTPRSGEPDINYLFLVTYSDPENAPPEYVQLVIDDKKYDLSPINDKDDNYTDGKDFKIKVKLSEGIHLYHFEASNGEQATNTLVSPIQIKKADPFTHLDVTYSVLIATIMLLIPLIYGLHLMKRIADNLSGNREAKVHKKNK
jgi:hypothetical protein